MQFIVKFVAAIVPYLLRFLDRHSDEYLEALSKRIIALIGEDREATIRFYIINKKGEPVTNAVAGFNVYPYGKLYKHADGNIIDIAGFESGEYEFQISAKDCTDEIVNIDIKNENIIIEKVVVLK